MIAVSYGTARLVMKPALASRGDDGTNFENYDGGDLVAVVSAVVRTMKMDPVRFGEAILKDCSGG